MSTEHMIAEYNNDKKVGRPRTRYTLNVEDGEAEIMFGDIYLCNVHRSPNQVTLWNMASHPEQPYRTDGENKFALETAASSRDGFSADDNLTQKAEGYSLLTDGVHANLFHELKLVLQINRRGIWINEEWEYKYE